jgi:hypothetical protein
VNVVNVTTRARSSFLLGALLAGLAAACGPEAPENPTFAADVEPIMLARCVRCHNQAAITDPNFVPDPLSSDPLQTPNGAFESLEDPPNCTTRIGQPCRGLLSYTMNNPPNQLPGVAGPDNFKSRIHQDRSMVAALPMPPSPSPKLSDRNIAILDRWFANPLP